jgi:WD40 repeat protein
VSTRQALLRFAGHGRTLWALAISPDGRTALSDSDDSSMVLWDLETGKEMRSDGTLALWNLESGQLIRRSGGHGWTFDLALAPDGQSALFGSSDTTIVQWRIDNPTLDELEAWVATNRYLPELTCAEREMYQIEPLCDSTGAQRAIQP